MLQQPLAAWVRSDGEDLTVMADWHHEVGLPEGWQFVFNRLVCRDPAQRYPSPLAVLKDINALVGADVDASVVSPTVGDTTVGDIPVGVS